MQDSMQTILSQKEKNLDNNKCNSNFWIQLLYEPIKLLHNLQTKHNCFNSKLSWKCLADKLNTVFQLTHQILDRNWMGPFSGPNKTPHSKIWNEHNNQTCMYTATVRSLKEFYFPILWYPPLHELTRNLTQFEEPILSLNLKKCPMGSGVVCFDGTESLLPLFCNLFGILCSACAFWLRLGGSQLF